MSIWAVIGIIAIVLGVIISNIMLLKYSAKFKMPKAYTPPKASQGDDEKRSTPDSDHAAVDHKGNDSKH